MAVFTQFFKNMPSKVCLFSVTLIVFAVSFAGAAPPTVINPIANQTISSGDWFEIPIFFKPDVFNDIDNDVLNVTITKSDGSPLPSWIGYEEKIGASLEYTYDTPDSAYFGVTVSGNYAYVADGDSGLKIIDISNPSLPTLEGACDTPSYAREVAVSGSYAYVADGPSGLRIINIIDPSLPTLEGGYVTSNYACGVAVSGSYAYVADGDSGLQIIDISDPSAPSLEGSYNTPDYAYGVALSGNYAYVADHHSGLQIIDISNPSTPSFEGSYNTPNTPDYAYGVALSGNYAYVADGDSGLQIIDISNPSLPTLEGSFKTPGIALKVAVSGSYAYVADNRSGLQIIDIRDPSLLTLTETYDTPGSAKEVALSGNYAYVADHSSGLQVILLDEKFFLKGSRFSADLGILNLKATATDGVDEVSTPFSIDVQNQAPTVITSIPNQKAYVDNLFGMSFLKYEVFNDANYDFHNVTITKSDNSSLPTWLTYENKPINPTPKGACDTPGSAHGVAVSGSYAYVADYSAGLQIIDISDPSAPSLEGSCDTPGSAYEVAVSGSYAYVADYFAGLQIIDISDPSAPSLEGTYDTPGSACGVAVSGSYAYVADRSSGLQIIDINNPLLPTLEGTYDTPGSAHGVAVSGSYAYVADYDLGLQIININNSSLPTLEGTCNTPGYALGVAVSGSYAYVANNRSGLQIIDISDPSLPKLKCTYTPGLAWGVAVSGSYAYVADYFAGLQIIDISNPSLPKLKCTYDTPGYAHGVAVSGNYAYVADWDSGFQIISDIADVVDLSGTPILADVGTLNLKATVTDNFFEQVSTTFSIDIEQNVAPLVSDLAKLGTEDTVLTFIATDFINAFNDTNGHDLSKLQIVSLPNNGTLEFSTLPVVLDQEIDVADLGELAFEPDANWNGNTSFSWKGSDGMDYSASSANVNIQIATINDIPMISDVAKLGTEDIALTFVATDFTSQYSDADGDTLANIQVTTLPSNGVLKLSGDNVTVDQEIDVVDLGELTFEPNANWNGNTSFAWKGSDGMDYAASSANVNIQMAAVYDPPTVSDVAKLGTEDIALTFVGTDFTSQYSDVDGVALVNIQITTLPANGVLKLSGSNVTVNQEIDAADLGELAFEPNTNWNGNTSFAWKGSDGMNYSASSANVNIQIATINDIPMISDVAKLGTEDIALTFVATDFTSQYSDADGDTLANIQVTTLPSNGVLKLSGFDVTVDQEIDVADLGELTFEPDANWNGNTNFSWKGFDGTEYSASPANVNIQIASVNDSPVVTINQDSLLYDSCNDKIVIVDSITVEDDNRNLQGATVKLGGGVNLAIDSLDFVDQNGISGNYNRAVGELALTGSATLLEYQTALRNVTYEHAGNSVPSDQIMVYFSVNDEMASSIDAFRNITIDESIASCSSESTFTGWEGVIGGVLGIGAATFVATGITVATLYGYAQYKKKLNTNNNVHDISLPEVKAQEIDTSAK